MMPTQLPTVVVADDHQLMLDMIGVALEAEGIARVVATARDGAEAIERIAAHRPDVVILDVAMPRLNGIDVLRELRAREFKVRAIILSMHMSEDHVRAALDAGAAAFVPKHAALDELGIAVRAVMRGEQYISPLLEHVAAQPTQGQSPGPFGTLSPRERQVLQLLAQGLAPKQIAASLGIQPKTVYVFRTHLMHKLNLHSVAELVKYALRHGLAAN